MSNELVARIRKNRENKVTIGKHTFIFRRPTALEVHELDASRTSDARIAERFVIGWDGFTEDDVAGGGGSDKVEFTPLLWSEWIAERPELWTKLSEPIVAAYTLHKERMQEAGKN